MKMKQRIKYCSRNVELAVNDQWFENKLRKQAETTAKLRERRKAYETTVAQKIGAQIQTAI